jgi:hypothetical protein
MPSKRPSKKPAKRSKKPPPIPRTTIEVDRAWLMPDLPHLPTLPPLPASVRQTMEVKLEWLEDEDGKPKKKRPPLPPTLPREEPITTPPKSARGSKRPTSR